MKKETNHEQSINRQRGNALVYVLVAIVLFAALSFTLSRQSNTEEAGNLTAERAKFYATQMISYAGQARSVVDQMTLTGSTLDDLDFTDPTDTVPFNAGSHIHKVFHPEGGGLAKQSLADGAVTQSTNDPPPGWYIGRFNNVEWTELGPGNTNGPGGTEAPYEDVILTAFQISKPVCEQINYAITGTIAIPQMTGTIKDVMIDEDLYGAGGNTDFTTDQPGDICNECDNLMSLCVEDLAGDIYAFYTVVGER